MGYKKRLYPCAYGDLSKNPLVILDGAHNPDGAMALSKFMEDYSGKITALIGVMKDKNYKDVLSLTLKHCKSVVCVTPNDLPRALKGEELIKEAKEYCPDATFENSILEGFKTAKEKAENEPIFIFGSLYLASNIRKYFKE